MEKSETLVNESILQGHSDEEKAAYLAAIASIATADKEANPQELEYITHLCETAELPDALTQKVLNAAKETSGEELKQSLDILKNSQLKYLLIADMMAFAKSDSDYSEAESQYVSRIAHQLGIDQQQFGLLNQFADNVNNSEAGANKVEESGFFSGIKEKMENAGINTGSLLKGVIAIAGPILLARMLKRKGGVLGGLGNILAGAGLAGGIGSLIGMLGGGKRMGTTGGLLDRVLRGKF